MLSESEIQQIVKTVKERLGTDPDPTAVAGAVAKIIGGLSEKPTPEAHRSEGAAVTELPPAVAVPPARAAAAIHTEFEETTADDQRIIVAAFGRNRPGVAAALTAVLAECECDIADITQKILQEFFSMIMIVDIASSPTDFATLRQKLQEIESRLGITIVAQHQNVFRAMHRI